MMKYKGYIGKIELDEDADVLHGEVINTRDVITFEGKTVAEIRQAFMDSIEDYLEFCEERGEKPEKPFSGKLTIRVNPELHRKAYVCANMEDKSLNAWISDMLNSAVSLSGH